jgi:sodium-dependent multivitamin transporter 6
MTILDWAVIAIYLAGIVGIAIVLGKKQHDQQDYYLAGRTTRWWHSGFSTMATQLGAISFVSAPAFVALRDGGGMKWLCYEFGVPLGLLIVIIFILPVLHRGGYISIYEYLERRFDRRTRILVSILFQLGRGLATAVTVLAGGLILSTALPITTAQAIIIIGAVTILYDALGGLRVVILSDVIQMFIIMIGIVVCGAAALRLVGWNAAWQALTPERLRVLDFGHWGGSAEGAYGFWPMAIGGIFLYASYYGCDQSQVQRELSVGDLDGVRKSLFFNVFGRFPVVLLYCIMGVFVGAVFTRSGLLARLASNLGMETATVTETLGRDPDRMVPMFVLAYLPPGLIGLVFIGILSALMSSLDSAINSLSAVTMTDFYKAYIRPEASDRHYLVASKVLTLLWGAFCIAAAIAFAAVGEATRQTTIVLINAIGSLLYGPILAAFLLGIITKRVRSIHIVTGVIIGIAVNVLLWQTTVISWLWWNLTGFAATVAVAGFLSFTGAGGVATATGEGERAEVRTGADTERHIEAPVTAEPRWRFSYTLVIVYFFVIIAVAYLIQKLA